MVGTATVDTAHNEGVALWRSGANPVLLPNAAGINAAYGAVINGDGTVIGGTASNDNLNNNFQAFIWTQANGMQLIQFVVNDTSSGVAGISLSGTKLVGSAGTPPQAYLRNNGSSTRLTFPGNGYDDARGISRDGSTAIGTGTAGAWISVNGGAPQLISTILTNAGVDLGGFPLVDVATLSANGKVVAGIGGASTNEGWIAYLP